jgi:hypothetical protein
MKKEEVIKQLIAILNEFKGDDRGAEEVEIVPTTIPISDIPSFDSLLGVTATAHIAVAFDIPDDKKIDNLFGNTKQNGEVVYFSVEQIAEKIMKIKQG